MAAVQIVTHAFHRWSEQASMSELIDRRSKFVLDEPVYQEHAPDMHREVQKAISVIDTEIKGRGDIARVRKMSAEERLALVQSYR